MMGDRSASSRPSVCAARGKCSLTPPPSLRSHTARECHGQCAVSRVVACAVQCPYAAGARRPADGLGATVGVGAVADMTSLVPQLVGLCRVARPPTAPAGSVRVRWPVRAAARGGSALPFRASEAMLTSVCFPFGSVRVLPRPGSPRRSTDRV